MCARRDTRSLLVTYRPVTDAPRREFAARVMYHQSRVPHHGWLRPPSPSPAPSPSLALTLALTLGLTLTLTLTLALTLALILTPSPSTLTQGDLSVRYSHRRSISR